MFINDVLHGKGHTVVTARDTESVQSAVAKLAEHRIGAVVVEDQWMRHAGIFTERDFVNAVARQGAAVLAWPVSKLMSSPAVTCAPQDRVDAVMAVMTLARIRHLPVEENGRLVGIVSIGDLVKHRLDEKALEAEVLLDIARLHV